MFEQVKRNLLTEIDSLTDEDLDILEAVRFLIIKSKYKKSFSAKRENFLT